MSKESALRYNDGKPRYDLLHPIAQRGIVNVLTKGAVKYSPKNWHKGMSWMSVLASMKRHIAAFELGEDIDPETGELHVDHIQCNAHFLSAYYTIAPQYDDRIHLGSTKPKIGLDIDEVICEWVGDWTNYWDIPRPTSWFFDYDILAKFDQMREHNELDEFYRRLKPKCDPSDIPFEPHCYVTSRPVSTEITKEWLLKHGFPAKPVITVAVGQSKVDAIREAGVDIFVDDRYDNFEELNRNGICCYLFDALHNQRYSVGYRRIKSLKELRF